MAKSSKIDLSKRRLRSAVSNGTRVLADVDHRGPEMRRLKDLLSDHVSDLGGSDNVTHAEKLLASRASMIALLCEMSERTFIKNQLKVHPRELETYLHSVGNLNRVLVTLGLKRRAKPVLSLKEYLATRESGSIEEVETEEVME